jgi:hypothetical protein
MPLHHVKIVVLMHGQRLPIVSCEILGTAAAARHHARTSDGAPRQEENECSSSLPATAPFQSSNETRSNILYSGSSKQYTWFAHSFSIFYLEQSMLNIASHDEHRAVITMMDGAGG